MKDYYVILNVQRDASQEAIKKSFRNLANVYHPDRHTNNPLQKLADDKFKEINEAYGVLGNFDKRKEYDQMLQNGSYNDSAATSTAANSSEEQFFSRFNELIDDLFNRRLWKDVHEACEVAFKQYPKEPWPVAVSGYAYYQEGNFSQAISSFKTAEMKGLQDGDVFRTIGQCYIELNNYNVAIGYLEKAHKLQGNDPNTLAYLALAYDLNGNSQAYERYFNQLKHIDPNHEFVKQREQMIKVGNQYVKKDDAAVGACGICALLECIFDCC